jgi:hypothetical protein
MRGQDLEPHARTRPSRLQSYCGTLLRSKNRTSIAQAAPRASKKTERRSNSITYRCSFGNENAHLGCRRRVVKQRTNLQPERASRVMDSRVVRRGFARHPWSVWAVAPLFCGACGGRSVPMHPPAGSAASVEAGEARPHAVVRALRSDPPLPGESSPAGDWPGLETSREVEPAGTPRPADSEAHQYQCPMHPDVVSTEPGRCPRCGMALVERR